MVAEVFNGLLRILLYLSVSPRSSFVVVLHLEVPFKIPLLEVNRSNM